MISGRTTPLHSQRMCSWEGCLNYVLIVSHGHATVYTADSGTTIRGSTPQMCVYSCHINDGAVMTRATCRQ